MSFLNEKVEKSLLVSSEVKKGALLLQDEARMDNLYLKHNSHVIKMFYIMFHYSCMNFPI